MVFRWLYWLVVLSAIGSLPLAVCICFLQESLFGACLGLFFFNIDFILVSCIIYFSVPYVR